MRMKIEDLETAYEKCLDGKIVFSERVDKELAESLMEQARGEFEEALNNQIILRFIFCHIIDYTIFDIVRHTSLHNLLPAESCFFPQSL